MAAVDHRAGSKWPCDQERVSEVYAWLNLRGGGGAAGRGRQVATGEEAAGRWVRRRVRR